VGIVKFIRAGSLPVAEQVGEELLRSGGPHQKRRQEGVAWGFPWRLIRPGWWQLGEGQMKVSFLSLGYPAFVLGECPPRHP